MRAPAVLRVADGAVPGAVRAVPGAAAPASAPVARMGRLGFGCRAAAGSTHCGRSQWTSAAYPPLVPQPPPTPMTEGGAQLGAHDGAGARAAPRANGSPFTG